LIDQPCSIFPQSRDCLPGRQGWTPRSIPGPARTKKHRLLLRSCRDRLPSQHLENVAIFRKAAPKGAGNRRGIATGYVQTNPRTIPFLQFGTEKSRHSLADALAAEARLGTDVAQYSQAPGRRIRESQRRRQVRHLARRGVEKSSVLIPRNCLQIDGCNLSGLHGSRGGLAQNIPNHDQVDGGS